VRQEWIGKRNANIEPVYTMKSRSRQQEVNIVKTKN